MAKAAAAWMVGLSSMQIRFEGMVCYTCGIEACLPLGHVGRLNCNGGNCYCFGNDVVSGECGDLIGWPALMSSQWGAGMQCIDGSRFVHSPLSNCKI